MDIQTNALLIMSLLSLFKSAKSTPDIRRLLYVYNAFRNGIIHLFDFHFLTYRGLS